MVIGNPWLVKEVGFRKIFTKIKPSETKMGVESSL